MIGVEEIGSGVHRPRAFPGLERSLTRDEWQTDSLELHHNANLVAEPKPALLLAVQGLRAAERAQ